MDRFSYRIGKCFSCSSADGVLSRSWFSGLILGAILSLLSSGNSKATFHSIIYSHVNTFGLICTIFFPVIISALAIYVSRPWLLIPIGFFKALSFSFVATGIMLCFGSSGWLIALFLLFSDFCMLPIYFYFWTIFLSGEVKLLAKPLVLISSAGFVVFLLDLFVISPFFTDISSY